MIFGISALLLAASVFFYRNMPRRWIRRGLVGPPTPPAENGAAREKNATEVVLLNSTKTSINGHISSALQIDTASSNDEAATPKARPFDQTPSFSGGTSIPTFSLQDGSPPSSDDESDFLPPLSFPALNSAQRASVPRSSTLMEPLPRPNVSHSQRPNILSRPSTAQLMPPPPPPPSSSLSPPPSAASSLRVPPGRSANILPLSTTSRTSPGASSLASMRTPPTPNPRKKVLLHPGHSPLDWAALVRDTPNLSGVPSLQRVTPSQLRQHNGRRGRPAWSSFQGKVYNVTPYLPFHPGGEGELRRAAGRDGGKLFMEVHPWVSWESMLGGCMVGIMVSEGGEEEEGLEGID